MINGLKIQWHENLSSHSEREESKKGWVVSELPGLAHESDRWTGWGKLFHRNTEGWDFVGKDLAPGGEMGRHVRKRKTEGSV